MCDSDCLLFFFFFFVLITPWAYGAGQGVTNQGNPSWHVELIEIAQAIASPIILPKTYLRYIRTRYQPASQLACPPVLVLGPGPGPGLGLGLG
jgi:hypothetical protein